MIFLDTLTATKTITVNNDYIYHIVGYIFTFFSGGFAGALYTRHHLKKDRIKQEESNRILPKLTLKTVKEEVKLGSTYLHKVFELINNTDSDYENGEIGFEFDNQAVITKSYTKCKEGKNKLVKNNETNNVIKFTFKQLNREEVIIFIFHIDKWTDNKCRPFLICKGAGLSCIDRNHIDLPRISPNKFETNL